MTLPTFPSSPQALATKIQTVAISKYPWRTMDVHTSFHVAANTTKLSTLQSSASRMGKKLKRNFKVVDHGKDGIEVARLPDNVGIKEPNKANFFEGE